MLLASLFRSLVADSVRGRRCEVKLCEFGTTSHEASFRTELFAFARYKRGDVPTHDELDYIDKRAKACSEKKAR